MRTRATLPPSLAANRGGGARGVGGGYARRGATVLESGSEFEGGARGLGCDDGDREARPLVSAPSRLAAHARGGVMAQTALGARRRAATILGVSLHEYERHEAAGEKWCTRCKAWHSRVDFAVDASRWDGLSASCRRGRAVLRKAMYQPRPRRSKLGVFFVPARDGDKRQARARTNHAVQTGLLPSPAMLPCTDCGHVTDGKRRHEYDHYLGYAAEHQLTVQAVCSRCHHERERRRTP